MSVHTAIDYLIDEIIWMVGLPGDRTDAIAADRALLHQAVRDAIQDAINRTPGDG